MANDWENRKVRLRQEKPCLFSELIPGFPPYQFGDTPTVFVEFEPPEPEPSADYTPVKLFEPKPALDDPARRKVVGFDLIKGPVTERPKPAPDSAEARKLKPIVGFLGASINKKSKVKWGASTAEQYRARLRYFRSGRTDQMMHVLPCNIEDKFDPSGQFNQHIKTLCEIVYAEEFITTPCVAELEALLEDVSESYPCLSG